MSEGIENVRYTRNKNQERNLEYEMSNIHTQLKNLKNQHHRAIIEESVEELLKLQEEEGSLDKFTIKTYLGDFGMKIRNLYDK